VVYGRGAGYLPVAVSAAELGERETGGGGLGRLEKQLLLLLRYGERRRRLRVRRPQPYWVGGRAVEYQLPLLEYAGLVDVTVAAVVHGHRPRAVHLLAPVVHGQERPVVEVGADHIPRSFEQ